MKSASLGASAALCFQCRGQKMEKKSRREEIRETVIGCVVVLVVGYVGYRHFFPTSPPAEIPAETAPVTTEAESSNATTNDAEATATRADQAGFDTAAEVTAAKERDHEQKYGFHCLSPWDGSMPEFERLVIARVADRDSYELEKTSTLPVNAKGKNVIMTQFRVRNATGGMVFARAVGSFDNATCEAITLDFVE